MGMEATGRERPTDAELDARAIKNAEIEARISALSDQEFIDIPELRDPKTGERIVTGVEYLELEHSGRTDAHAHIVAQLERAYPKNYFISAVAEAIRVFTLPFRYVDTWENSGDGHVKRRAWRSSLPFPIGDRLSKIAVTGNNINAQLRNPFTMAESLYPEEFEDVTFKKLAEDAQKLSAAFVFESNALDPKDKHSAAIAIAGFYAASSSGWPHGTRFPRDPLLWNEMLGNRHVRAVQ